MARAAMARKSARSAHSVRVWSTSRRGGTTPLVGAYLVSRTGAPLAPAVYLAAAGVVSFIAALFLPRAARHRLTHEFQAARPR
jgi:hypothetical protein